MSTPVPYTEQKYNKKQASSIRPAAMDVSTNVLPTSHKNDQQPWNRAPLSIWCRKGVLRSKKTSVVGGQTWYNRWWFGVWLVPLWNDSKQRSQQPSRCLRRDDSLRDLQLLLTETNGKGDISAGVMIQHVYYVTQGSHLEHVVFLAIPHRLRLDIA